MVDPLDYEAIKDMAFHGTKEVKPYIATRKEIQEAIDQHYHLDDSVEHIVNETVGIFQGSGLEIAPAKSSSEIIPADYLEKKSRMAPIVRMVNFIFLKAINSRASDIHIEPLKAGLSVRFRVDGINQIQVQPEIGLTFANTLRSILRQDPNVILVGEIRDLETAEIAFRAAMTGHLVLSTLHTNDSVSTITRLADMGVPRYMIASSVTGIVAQRLVRKTCSKCRVKAPVAEEGLRKLHVRADLFEGVDLYRGQGCPFRNQTGFYGRIGIYEIFQFTSKIRECVAAGGTEEEIRLIAQGFNMPTMGDDGIAKVKEGETTIEEVLRVIELEEDVRTLCPRCRKPLHLDFVVCPYCKYEVQRNCLSCNRPLRAEWVICLYCKKEAP